MDQPAEVVTIRPWYYWDVTLLIANALTMAALLGIYGTALDYGEWPERNVVLFSTAPFIGTTYVIWLAAIAGRMCTKKDTIVNTLRAFNSYWALANAVAGPAVFVAMSWMDTPTKGHRYWSYITQMSAVVVTAVGIYVARGVDVAKERSRQEEQLAFAGLTELAGAPMGHFVMLAGAAAGAPVGPWLPPVSAFAPAPPVVVNGVAYSSTVITVGGKRKFKARRGADDAMVVDNLRGDRVKVYVYQLGEEEPFITFAIDGVVLLPRPME